MAPNNKSNNAGILITLYDSAMDEAQILCGWAESVAVVNMSVS